MSPGGRESKPVGVTEVQGTLWERGGTEERLCHEGTSAGPELARWGLLYSPPSDPCPLPQAWWTLELALTPGKHGRCLSLSLGHPIHLAMFCIIL